MCRRLPAAKWLIATPSTPCPTSAMSQASRPLVPGVRLDVGQGTGSSRIAQVYASARGLVNLKETTWNVDGLPASSMQSNGQVNIFLNEAMSQEVTYQTGGSAENPSAGLRINVIPRDGGNVFRGGASFQGHPAGVGEQQHHRRAARQRLHRGKFEGALLRRQWYAWGAHPSRSPLVLRVLPAVRRATAAREHV